MPVWMGREREEREREREGGERGKGGERENPRFSKGREIPRTHPSMTAGSPHLRGEMWATYATHLGIMCIGQKHTCGQH